MNDIITIALKAFPVIALITTGVVLEKTAFISAEAVKGMKKLIMNLALPCLLFLILLDADLQPDYLWGSVAVFLTCLLAFSMGFLFKKIWKSSNAFFSAVYSSFVTGAIGYPLFISTSAPSICTGWPSSISAICCSSSSCSPRFWIKSAATKPAEKG